MQRARTQTRRLCACTTPLTSFDRLISYVKTEMTGGDEGPGDLTVEESVTST